MKACRLSGSLDVPFSETALQPFTVAKSGVTETLGGLLPVTLCNDDRVGPSGGPILRGDCHRNDGIARMQCYLMALLLAHRSRQED